MFFDKKFAKSQFKQKKSFKILKDFFLQRPDKTQCKNISHLKK